ncbi:conserved hypothetical protein [Meyerozyma guilliermondii ATCC 6260]|uniref:Uncharacterized protein n=1 Tax=Meyerozyma guilliermondii (strain ATCC 6260 / CBS 566 / DSM 6381 / JCM 1539 / NBRC 10279 / NRRL Y-324) TaxID=294746 RepID=A5DPB5_PICGU|nr:uncharacterized protein PGUG_05116 [Meyerozyma guilliermondii ATCC 6260]EDK41018.2 conserved hypothetical protein [Meyerozyma guilliermondii ATCC 6260]
MILSFCHFLSAIVTLASLACLFIFSLLVRSSLIRLFYLSVWSVSINTVLQFLLPLITILQQLLLIIQQLLSGLGRILHIWRLHDGIHGTRFSTVATVDTLGHVNVVLVGSSQSIGTFFCLDGDGLCWANSFTQLTCNTSLFTAGVSPQSVFSSESGRDGSLFKWVIDGIWSSEEHLHTDVHSSGNFTQEKKLGGLG